MHNNFSLEGKYILVTGAGSGIGFETVKILLEANVKILAVDKEENLLAELHNDSRITFLRADITNKEDQLRINDAISSNLDGMVNCAGIIDLLPMRFVSEKKLYEINNNNYLAPVLLTNLLLKKKNIARGGSVLFISSVMSVVSTQTNGMYTASKSALAGITKTYALELASQEIRVNAISPGFVKTPMLEHIAKFTDLKEAEKKHPLGLGEAKDVANSIVFMLSDASRWITGSNLLIDGGYSAQ